MMRGKLKRVIQTDTENTRMAPFCSETTSLTSQTDSISLDTEWTPNSIFFLTHHAQCQTPGGALLKGGSRQERWYLLWHPFPSQHLKLDRKFSKWSL